MNDMTEPCQYLSFTVADKAYAIELLRVREIAQLARLTRVPSIQLGLRGVMSHRGAVVPVLDLAAQFGLPETPLTRRTCVVIVDASMSGEPSRVGVLADAVREVIELGPDDDRVAIVDLDRVLTDA